MRYIFSLVFLFVFLFSKTSAQTETYKKLLDTAISPSTAIFVNAKPTGSIRLDKSEMWEYYNNYIEDSKLMLDTVMFAQIIQNSKTADASQWTDSELDRLILIKNRSEPVDINYVIRKFNLTDNRQIKAWKKTITNFNSTNPTARSIYSYSRPVFDNSKQFAIVQWDNEHNGISAEGGIILYHLADDAWEQLGTVTSWKY